jgi:hypothetical protein
MTDSLKSKAIHGLFWNSLERIGEQGIHFVVVIVLARFLAPEEFGLRACCSFSSPCPVFVTADWGPPSRKKATTVDTSSIFINVSWVSLRPVCL